MRWHREPRTGRAGPLLLAVVGLAGEAAGAAAWGPPTRIVTASGHVVGEASGLPALSADCARLAFERGGGIHVLDRTDGRDALVSLAYDGRPADRPSALPSLSADGRVLAYTSWARNLVPGRAEAPAAYVRDLATGDASRLPLSGGMVVVAPNGRAAIYDGREGREREPRQIFLHVFGRRRPILVSASDAGSPANADAVEASASFDARRVAFASAATNLVPGGDASALQRIFVRDTRRGTTRRPVRGLGGADPDGHSDFPSLDWSGRWLAFASEATNLVPADTNDARDVFVHDLVSGRTRRISRAAGGGDADGASDFPVGSADGRFVAFASRATNLVTGDENGAGDVFVHDRRSGVTQRLSAPATGEEPDDESGNFGVRISADGRCVGFESWATNLVPDDANRRADFFLSERPRAAGDRRGP